MLILVLLNFSAEAMPLENSSVWETSGKTFEAWICPLVFSLIGHCTDVILRYFHLMDKVFNVSFHHSFISVEKS